MLEASTSNELPAIPNKRYFTIGEVSELCAVKPHVRGARQQLSGDNAREDTLQSQQVIRQLRAELEEILKILKS
jgi:hypothetical protein